MAFDISFNSAEPLPVPNVIVRKTLLKPELVNVVYEGGELVTVHFGNVPVSMHYEDAIKISNFIRVRAKQAKKASGDVSRHWSVIGVLDGLE